MDEQQQSSSQIVKAGMLKLCNDFSPFITQFGFTHVRSGSRSWRRKRDGMIDEVHFHRSGSSYGRPINNSVSIRVEFFINVIDSSSPIAWLDSDNLRDSNDRAYHLRFNALTWSTYDRCLQDLERVTREHGLPWFAQQRV